MAGVRSPSVLLLSPRQKGLSMIASPITAAQYILDQQQKYKPRASGSFSWLLCGITLAAKVVAAQVRRAGLSGIIGAADNVNVQGEMQQKLDVFANNALLHALGNRGNVGILASEENEEPVVVLENPEHGEYIVVFDPLDGSSNIDLNVSVGTIFSIFRRDPVSNRPAINDVLQPGRRQVAAGYVLYGSSTMLVYTTGHGVHGFTLDMSIGAFVLSHPNIRMPDRGNLYSVNEANADHFPAYCNRFLHWLKSGDGGSHYSSRYIGSLVADFHRTMLKGGVFMYPPTAHYPEGKLRLMYEANPIAWLAEQAGGVASDGVMPILDITPNDLHQRTPLFVGSRYEMDRLHSLSRQTVKV
ncbi:MAG TPA: class 1 fructose-bisphosphatase [Pirellulales bacterium]|jgi:fructose-1,6-bisphosphatase I|nr:class 1 fructose-bisphosphatase [Pirellulales bacterium]